MSAGKGRRIESQRRDGRGRFVKTGSPAVEWHRTEVTGTLPDRARQRRIRQDRQLHRRFFYRLVKLFYLLFWPL